MHSIYLEHTEPYDKARAETWKGDMEGTLIFAGLFSAIITAFLVDSYKILQFDNSQATAQLLVRVVAALENKDPTSISIPINSNPSTVISLWINCLWFLSLIFSLSSALLATMVQQWAREYLQRPGQRPSIHQRARLRTVLAEGVNKWGVDTFVNSIPLLLHAALLLFFAGLIAFSFTIHTTLAYVIIGGVVPAVLSYAILTGLPAIFHDCPYKTPLSSALREQIRLICAIFKKTTRSGPRTDKSILADLKSNVKILRWMMATWDNSRLLTDANIEVLLGAVPDILLQALQLPAARMMSTIDALFPRDTSLLHDIPRLLRSCGSRRQGPPLHSLTSKEASRAEMCLKMLSLLTRMSGTRALSSSLHDRILDRCLLPSVEDVVYLLRPEHDAPSVRTLAYDNLILLTWHTMCACRYALKTINQAFSVHTLTLDGEEDTTVLFMTLFKIQNRLHVLLRPFVSYVLSKELFLPPDSDLAQLADHLDEQFSLGEGDGAKRFRNKAAVREWCNTQLQLVKGSFCAVYLSAVLTLTHEAEEYPETSRTSFEVIDALSTHLGWEENIDLDDRRRVQALLKQLMRADSTQTQLDGQTVSENGQQAVYAPLYGKYADKVVGQYMKVHVTMQPTDFDDAAAAV